MILLVKEVNEILRKGGLPDLTVVRSDDGILSIAGRKCGKPVLQIPMLSVGKKLTAKEREIIIDDYLQPLLTKHLAELIVLVGLSQDTTARDAHKAFKESEKLANFSHSANTVNAYMTPVKMSDVRSYSTRIKLNKEDDVKVTKEVGKKNHKLEINFDIQDTKKVAEDMKKLGTNVEDIIKHQNAYIKSYKAQIIHENKIQEAASKLITVCEF